ncbi:uncharacterized protein LOC122856425 [Aphidius gifuensis]|uniref:uncharacterized protein LOC122856425 n=1 Tax=Aphidius gifuensis TaxID=684658 RepID=UPI001CDD517F|nr:uncharacterized protein LOC122856425 [Aphidius gifuensis]
MPNFDVFIGCFPMEDSHTAVNLRLAFQNVLKEFELKESKLMCVTSDRAANISKALREAVGENKHLGCFAHGLSLLVPDALNNNTDLDMKKLKDTIDKVRAIVKFVKKSTLVSGELKRLQMLLGDKPEGQCLKLKKDMAIRWNSTLFMIERFLQLEQHLPMSLKASEAKSKPSMLSQEELDILRDAVLIMQTVGFAITDISGNKYPTVSLVIPLINCMRKEISLIEPHTICGKKFKTNLQQQMEHRFKNIECNILMTVATLLDPRFKDAHFQLNMTIVNTKNQLKKIINSTSASSDPVIVQNAGKTCSLSTQKSLWSHHAAIITSRNTKNVSYNDFDNQISNYLKEPLLNPEENPLEAWKNITIFISTIMPSGNSIPMYPR